jgi:hypothetical protein
MNPEQLIEQVTGDLIKVLAQKGELKSTLETVEKRETELRAFIEGVKAVQPATTGDVVPMPPKSAE